MVATLLVLATVTVCVPVAAIVVTSLAIRREESAWSLGSPPRDPVQAVVRRMLAFHSECDLLPRPKSRCQAQTHAQEQARASSPAPEAESADFPIPVRRRHHE